MKRDVVIIGGGFYGCCLALYMRSVADRVTLIETQDDLLTRASFVNQARIHTGFHYPRSFVTAKRSLLLYRRFLDDFRPAVEDNFRMLYAIARRGSKISARRFAIMYADLGASFAPATAPDKALFSEAMIEDAFVCEEFAYNALALRAFLRARLEAAQVEIMLGTRVVRVRAEPDGVTLILDDGRAISGAYAFRATYARLNHLELEGESYVLPVKHELTEVALIEPPEQLAALGVTVIDGAFFSVMPFPAQAAYSLTHVRYTPQFAWIDNGQFPHGAPPQIIAPQSRWLHMVRDAERYMPCASEFRWRTSLFEIKTVLQRNEIDDGRPIFVHRHQSVPRMISVLGGKLDNIYDLAEVLSEMETQWAGLDMRWFTLPPERKKSHV